MSEIKHTPTQSYWNDVRKFEETIFQRNAALTATMYPEFESVEKWTPEFAEPTGNVPDAVFDSVMYRAKRWQLPFWASRLATLTVFSDDEVIDPDDVAKPEDAFGLARIYWVSLRPEKERLRVLSVAKFLDQGGVVGGPESTMKSNKWVVTRTAPGYVVPNDSDYEFVHTEFQRNQHGAYTRWRPMLDSEPET